jgi:alpha-galactosidase
MKKYCFFIFLSVSQMLSAQKFEGLAPTPPMGWNSWNTFKTEISEKLVMETADRMVSSGMRDAGYLYLVLDDGWMAKERDSLGNMIADPEKFPRGMKVLADYIHARGLKFGLYNCAGTRTCADYPGTRGYEYQDARFYASQGVDYLKFDWCNTEGINAEEAYTTMSKALKAAGRPMIFSLCEWGTAKPWLWAARVGQLWRTTGDIGARFDGLKNMGTWSSNGAMTILDAQDTLRAYAGPGHWNDPDMLEVGNGLTENENRAHFSMWCIIAAPLIAGNDLRKMNASTQAILTNKEVIAVDQDSLGIQGFKYRVRDSLETWLKPLADGDWVICFLNRKSTAQNINFSWQKESIEDTLSRRTLNAGLVNYKLVNLWTKKNAGTTQKPLSAMIPPKDVLMIRLEK